jgi:hypothetical protein
MADLSLSSGPEFALRLACITDRTFEEADHGTYDLPTEVYQQHARLMTELIAWIFGPRDNSDEQGWADSKSDCTRDNSSRNEIAAAVLEETSRSAALRHSRAALTR